MLEYQNTIFYIDTFLFSFLNFVIKKASILFHGHMLLVILTEKKLLERFKKKNCKTKIKTSSELKK